MSTPCYICGKGMEEVRLDARDLKIWALIDTWTSFDVDTYKTYDEAEEAHCGMKNYYRYEVEAR